MLISTFSFLCLAPQDSSMEEHYVITEECAPAVYETPTAAEETKPQDDITEPETNEEVKARNLLYGKKYIKHDGKLYLSESENEGERGGAEKMKKKKTRRGKKKNQGMINSAEKQTGKEEKQKDKGKKHQIKAGEMIQTDLCEFVESKKRVVDDTSFEKYKGSASQNKKFK